MTPHYTRLLVARRGRPAHVAELEAMAAWIEAQCPVVARYLPAEMLRRLEEIEGMPAASEYASPAADAEPAKTNGPRQSTEPLTSAAGLPLPFSPSREERSGRSCGIVDSQGVAPLLTSPVAGDLDRMTEEDSHEAADVKGPEPRPSEVRAVPSTDAWATSAHQWGCGCTHPSVGSCGKCAGSCLCHVGVASAPEIKEVSNG